MTEKTARILRKMSWKRLNDSVRRDRILNDFNRDQMDNVGPIGGEEQGMKILSEMNAMVDDHDAFVQSLTPPYNR